MNASDTKPTHCTTMRTARLLMAALVTCCSAHFAAADEKPPPHEVLKDFALPEALFANEDYFVPRYIKDLSASPEYKPYYDGKALSDVQKTNLAKLFIHISNISSNRYGQTFYIQKTNPLCTLLFRSFPELRNTPTEPPDNVRLDDIESVLLQVLRK